MSGADRATERDIDRGPASGFAGAGGDSRDGGTGESAPVLRRTVAAPPAAVLEAIGEAAEQWGAAWEKATEDGVAGSGNRGGDRPRGRLALPVVAGLRHGRLDGELSAAGAGAGGETALELTVDAAHYTLWKPAVVILTMAAVGGILTVLWPFFPVLLPLAPFGALIALSAWLLILAKLQNRGPEEFLEMVALLAEEGPAAEDADGPGSSGATEAV